MSTVLGRPPHLSTDRFHELDLTFSTFEEWNAFQEQNPLLRDRQYIDDIVSACCSTEFLLGHTRVIRPGSDLVVSNNNYRESLQWNGLNPRLRLVLELVSLRHPSNPDFTSVIYAPEALTRAALELRSRYARFFGSEYVEELTSRRNLFPIPFQDILSLTIPDDSVDTVVSNEVFEHVPNLPRAFSEVKRILRPREGMLIATFPFAYGRPDTVYKARMTERGIEFFSEPEYHGNPAEPDRGCLVFQIPAWDILDMIRAAGFSSAVMRFVSSPRRAIVGAEIAGIFVLEARC